VGAPFNFIDSYHQVLTNPSPINRLSSAARDQISASFLALLSAYIASSLTSVVSSSSVNATQSSGNISDVIPSSTAINNHESAADQLYKFMNLPRCKSIDFSLKEEQTGTTLLHEGLWCLLSLALLMLDRVDL
jgi:hypothetical protein